jgi:hypothetical protein
MLNFLFGTKKRQPSERDLDRAWDKGIDLLDKVKTYRGIWSILEAAKEINGLLPDGYTMQIPGAGTITQSKEGLILGYVADSGQCVRYTIAKRKY